MLILITATERQPKGQVAVVEVAVYSRSQQKQGCCNPFLAIEIT